MERLALEYTSTQMLNTIHDQAKEIESLKGKLAEANERYIELIMAVEFKHEGETRHQTALRYIKNYYQSGEGSQAKLQEKPTKET
jgi:recombinational DNA repair protein RecR